MKVVHLDTGRDWRGGQAQVLMLLAGLRARGHESILLAPRGPLLERAWSTGIAVREWNAGGDWDLGAAWKARTIFERERPTVVHAHTARAHALGIPAARVARVPVRVVSRRVSVPVGRTPWSWAKYHLPVSRYLCVSHAVAKALRSSGVSRQRIVVVHSGIDVEALRRRAEVDEPQGPDLRREISVPADTCVIGTVASLTPEKNHPLFLRAAHLVASARPQARFVWIGEGSGRSAFERMRSRHGLDSKVHLLGFRSDATDLMRQLSVFVMPSALEGICVSILEAQALGVPVAASRAGGIPEVIEDGSTGRLCSPNDPKELADAILGLLDNSVYARRLADQGKESVKRFSAQRMIEGTLEQYESLVAAKESKRRSPVSNDAL